jgi:hypothetical protein
MVSFHIITQRSYLYINNTKYMINDTSIYSTMLIILPPPSPSSLNRGVQARKTLIDLPAELQYGWMDDFIYPDPSLH